MRGNQRFGARVAEEVVAGERLDGNEAFPVLMFEISLQPLVVHLLPLLDDCFSGRTCINDVLRARGATPPHRNFSLSDKRINEPALLPLIRYVLRRHTNRRFNDLGFRGAASRALFGQLAQ